MGGETHSNNTSSIESTRSSKNNSNWKLSVDRRPLEYVVPIQYIRRAIGIYSRLNREVCIAYSYYRLTLKCSLLSTIVRLVSMQAVYTAAIKRFSSSLYVTSKYLTNTSASKV